LPYLWVIPERSESSVSSFILIRVADPDPYPDSIGSGIRIEEGKKKFKQIVKVHVFNVQCCRFEFRIRLIHVFLGLLDPDPLIRGTVSGSFYHQAKNI
jgi:hypothetical protein